jgi:hypothetical protein
MSMSRRNRETVEEMRVRLDRYERALEYLARGWPNPTGEESSAQLIGTIFDMQNFASAALAGVRAVSAKEIADMLHDAGVMTSATRAQLRKIFNGKP